MSVVCKNDFDPFYKVFVKGSPEKIGELCLSETLPADYEEVLARYTMQGYRVIALSAKELPHLNYRQVQKVQRDEIESDLTFLGLLVMENKLKPQTIGVIETLQRCEVRTIMATGDNVLTAISVARQCHMADPSKEIMLGELQQDKLGNARLKWSRQRPAVLHLSSTRERTEESRFETVV